MASKTLQAWHDNIRTLEPPTTATHRCRVCRAFWRVNDDGSWSLASKLCGECCDNEAMGEQIAPADQSDPEARLAEAERERDEALSRLDHLIAIEDEVDASHAREKALREAEATCPVCRTAVVGLPTPGYTHAPGCRLMAAEAKLAATEVERDGLLDARDQVARLEDDLDGWVTRCQAAEAREKALREALVRYVDDDAPCEYGGLEDCPGTPQFAPCRLHQARAALARSD
jgi:hypothetical protein